MSKSSKNSKNSSVHKQEKLANGPVSSIPEKTVLIPAVQTKPFSKEDPITPQQSYNSIPPATLAQERTISPLDQKLLFVLTIFTSWVRFYKIWNPPSVVFDEVHFGGFARKYIIGRFFMDVHPPLAKMLYAVVGYLAGFDGEFDFNAIGLEYGPANVPYVAMRMLPATLGVLTVLLTYSTLRASGCHSWSALFGAGLLAIENTFVTQSRFILLDSPLVFFVAITVYGFVKFQNYIPLTKDWIRYLFLAGLGLGATVSSKWVGIFTIGWCGLLTLWQLWWILADLKVTPLNYLYQFASRAVFLIFVPLSFYLSMFALHFVCLANHGDGASFMSPGFQATLQHTTILKETQADIAYGSVVTLRHVNTRGGFLHSHNHMYPTGSKQQQITLYPHKDHNNNWVIERDNYNLTLNDTSYDFVKHGDIIRLTHMTSNRRLHSHNVRPPVSEQDFQNEVSAYGYKGFSGDINDNFRVEIVPKQSEKGVASERLRAFDTQFRLIHIGTGCALFSHAVKLPTWGFEQQEVTCVKSGTFPNSVWMIDSNSHPRAPQDAEIAHRRIPSFLSKFWELNKVMWNVNAGLTSTHTWESRPESWPLLKRGINFWGKDHDHVYLLGNAPIYWFTTALIVSYLLFKGFELLRWQRGYAPFDSVAYHTFDKGMYTYVLGWATHYFPSFLMERQLFLHHYLASVFFGVLAIAQFFEFIAYGVFGSIKLFKLNRKGIYIGYALMAAFFAVSAGFFYHYSPLAYATAWTKPVCESSKFLDMDWNCGRYFDTYEEYYAAASKKALEAKLNGTIVATSTVNTGVTQIVPTPVVVKQEVPKPQPPVSKQEAPKKQPIKKEEPKPVVPKQEAPKPAAPKQEAPKQQPIKKEEPKPAAPKQEAPKPAAPKQEAPKQDAPKQQPIKKEEPKPAAPKQEAPKPAAPKQEAPKPAAPKQEAPKQQPIKKEAPKPAAPKQEAPKPAAPKQEAPKQQPIKKEEPKPAAPKQEAPKPAAPKQEAPKPAVPKQEAPKPAAPKPAAPKQEAPKPAAPKQEAPKQQPVVKKEEPKPVAPKEEAKPAAAEQK
ncbi:uncharacterized protein SAPINGB_P004543 [Magnusiomyces paraingens]|uniref:dolichyl-phosphate-mannose--protein mannosyltransferase n=1 Tax=Magnusiomyces paraingens TaxID=2606893 RepID=A0A5E8BW56_9ASCO|nr:uncharacterized protein SAPINGB_P004543 [Saprochaete ingens]VVT55331.1 unnamed protein product [Saprochaete ingens]